MGEKYISKVMIGEQEYEPIGVKQVIKGIRKKIYNEVTGKTTIVGEGEVLYDVSDKRRVPYFKLAYKSRRYS